MNERMNEEIIGTDEQELWKLRWIGFDYCEKAGCFFHDERCFL